MLLQNTSYSAFANNTEPSLHKAFLASFALHVLVLLAASFIATTPHPHRPAVISGIVVQLPNTRVQTDPDTDHSLTDTSASQTPISANALPDSELDSFALVIKTFVPQKPLFSDMYFRQSELASPASPLSEPAIPQPAEQLDGIAELTLLIGADGTVDAVQPGKSTLPRDYVNELKAFFLGMKFQPGMLHGIHVKSRFVVEVSATFAPEIIESRTLNDDQRSL